MSGLPTPPVEDQKSTHSRKASKHSKSSASRVSKRSSSSHEHCAAVADARHKRVWKACERCRMKKTKCDGESPCKRCKDDGLVCTAGSRKKTEFKQLPRGYAEVLENTQYALIATVQKLYTMIRNNESWELGDPDLNDRGLPVIHDIAMKLGCIRPSPDLPYAFPEGAEDFAELQAQLGAARSETHSEDTESRKASHDASYSPMLDRTERASSTESEHSTMSTDYGQIWSQQQSANKSDSFNINARPRPLNFAQRASLDDDSPYSSRAIPSPIFTDLQSESSTFSNASPFSPWSAGDDFLSPPNMLDNTAQYIPQQAYHQQIPRSSPLDGSFRGGLGLAPSVMKELQFEDLSFARETGTIRPGMLDCNTGYDLSMDSIIYPSDYEGQLRVV